ncbi:MAG: protease inhibitor I42 family protein [Acidimicrobiales bacterium]
MLFGTRHMVATAALGVVALVACGSTDEASTGLTTTTVGAESTTSAESGTTTTMRTPATGDEVTVTAADSGTSITLKPGDVVHIEIENCATCGYEWHETSPPDVAVLALTESHLIEPDRGDGMVGGYETAVFTYQAVASGTAQVDLGYHGPDGSIEDTFTLTVKVG